jgi:LacI family transcriptional regulator
LHLPSNTFCGETPKGLFPAAFRDSVTFLSVNVNASAIMHSSQNSRPMKPEKIGIYRIAELAEVSIGTVDRALHGRPGINEATRTRVLEVAERLGYRPNLAARALSIARSDLRIGICVPREIHFFYDQLWQGILEEAQRFSHLGIEFLCRPVKELGKGDADALESLLSSGVNGVILTPGNPAEMTPLIDRAESSGIRVICVSTDAPGSRRSTIVFAEPTLNGQMAGELLGKCLAPNSVAAVITGMAETEDHRKKTEGFCETFPRFCAGGKVGAVIEGREHEEQTHKKVLRLLNSEPALAGIYVTTVNSLPVCRALKETGNAGRVKVVTTDLFPEMIPFFHDGTISASIYQQPYEQGRTAVRLLLDHLASRAPIPRSNTLSPSIVLDSALSQFRETLATAPTATLKIPKNGRWIGRLQC